MQMNPAMSADYYEFTMAAAYLESGKENETAVFNAFYRSNPFGGGYTLITGTEQLTDYIEGFRFSSEDVTYMRKNWNLPERFFEYIREFRFTGTVEALPEGAAAFPYIPLVQVTAKLPEANLIESLVLNTLGFSTLISTKASRIAGQTAKPFAEFGLRRVAGGVEGGLITSRAAYIGGASATSNVAASYRYGIPSTGTMAHSFVMAYGSQEEAFDAYASVFGKESIFLVDTIDYLNGLNDVINTAKRKKLNKFRGIRDDSGDLIGQSKTLRKKLNEEGLRDVKIVASGDLDEYSVREFERKQAPVDLFGIGTKLVSADNSSALNIVYKLVQIGSRGVIKLSGDKEKTTSPGNKRLIRVTDGKRCCGDIVFLKNEPVPARCRSYVIGTEDTYKDFTLKDYKDILIPFIEKGKRCRQESGIEEIKANAKAELKRLNPAVLRLDNPAEYHTGLSPELYTLKNDLTEKFS